MFNCKLCNSQDYVYSGYLCTKCIKIQDIIKIYGSEKIVESLEFIYIRGATPIKKRTDVVSADSTYLYDKKDKSTKSNSV